MRRRAWAAAGAGGGRGGGRGRWLVVIAVAGVLARAGTAAAEPYPDVLLRALDKVTARVWTLTVPLNRAVAFGTLEIVVRHCDKRPPEEAPEAAAFLEIWEIRSAQLPVSLFKGWMFASSPGLSAIEHPVYDVWVLDCVTSADSSASSSPASSSP